MATAVQSAQQQSRSPEIREWSHQDLRLARHELANRIQNDQCRLWLLDDEIQRREREQQLRQLHLMPASASETDGRRVVGVEGVDSAWSPSLVEVV